MDKTIKVWQLVVPTVSLLLTMIGTIVVFTNKVETQRLRIEYLERALQDHSLQIKDLYQKNEQHYETIGKDVTEIKIALQNKENKK